ncbi:hypothetical protein IHE44_0002863 [Lamprotornis superbus]|uniref:N-acetylgalactosaminyl-proteoglycan 3-beta-glucuronosyltransferase n=1 Tax=Lamprotornis superbus TaxID=245042 RepID=A0A835P3G0_9PASS|nr:hypothetical protein IHE44_0002863 [Lamprotornis superbus]
MMTQFAHADGLDLSQRSMEGVEQMSALHRKGSSSVLFLFTKTCNEVSGKLLEVQVLGSTMVLTWSKTIPGKVEFFSSEGSDTSIPIPIVPLPGVDDSYPPQKKSFMMLKYMHDHYLDKYEWFMRADDDVYIKGDKLENFLRSLNSSEPLFLGQTGLGTTEEMGKLALEPGENFCMGGPGVIMSREVLRRMVPHIGECLREMYTTHEDVEVGRCVRRFAGVQCVWSYEHHRPTLRFLRFLFPATEYVMVSAWKMDDTIIVFLTAVEILVQLVRKAFRERQWGINEGSSAHGPSMGAKNNTAAPAALKN